MQQKHNKEAKAVSAQTHANKIEKKIIQKTIIDHRRGTNTRRKLLLCGLHSSLPRSLARLLARPTYFGSLAGGDHGSTAAAAADAASPLPVLLLLVTEAVLPVLLLAPAPAPAGAAPGGTAPSDAGLASEGGRLRETLPRRTDASAAEEEGDTGLLEDEEESTEMIGVAAAAGEDDDADDDTDAAADDDEDDAEEALPLPLSRGNSKGSCCGGKSVL